VKRKIFYGLATIVVGALSLAAVANGPYYAFPAWAQKLVCATTSNCPRFIVLADWNSEAVLDRETGLVWHKSPDGTSRTWSSARLRCNNLSLGNRKAWRLPTLQELASLVDPSIASPGPTLPAGHPFGTNVQSSFYWSATTNAEDTSIAWGVFFSSGNVVGIVDKGSNGFVWCVRGGQGVDPQ